MNADIMKVLGIFSTVLVLGLILKDSGQMNTVITSAAAGTTSILGTLEKAG